MTDRTNALVYELKRLNPRSPVLRFFVPENNVRRITLEDRERVAFRRLTLAVKALIERGERDE